MPDKKKKGKNNMATKTPHAIPNSIQYSFEPMYFAILELAL